VKSPAKLLALFEALRPETKGEAGC
jgi:hypothetical protein